MVKACGELTTYIWGLWLVSVSTKTNDLHNIIIYSNSCFAALRVSACANVLTTRQRRTDGRTDACCSIDIRTHL